MERYKVAPGIIEILGIDLNGELIEPERYDLIYDVLDNISYVLIERDGTSRSFCTL
jgi:hypothetical protein